MDKRGNSSILFIILIPIFLILALIIADTIVTYTENKTYKNITEDIIKKVYTDDINEDDYYKEIKRLYEEKGYETDSLVVNNTYNGIYVENDHNYFGIFSSLSKSNGITEKTKLLGITFIKKKNSKLFIKVTAKNDNYSDDKNKELTFEYEK